MKHPKLYKGGVSTDNRGDVKYFNRFSLGKVKRFYVVTHTGKTPRAFHGHMKESKYLCVVSGSALVCLVKINKPSNPSKRGRIKKFIISAKNPEILYIPPGYANGFKPLEKGTKVIFFSTLRLGDSLKDDHRFPYDYWGKDIWEVQPNEL